MNFLATPPVNTTSDDAKSPDVLLIVLALVLIILFVVLLISICRTRSSVEEKSEDGSVHTVTRIKRHPILAIFSIILILVVGLVLFRQCDSAQSNSNISDSTPQLLTRSARDSDVSISYDNESMWNKRYKITPNVDIADLEITFIYLDENRNELCSIVKTIGNVSEGTEYSVTVMSSEFSFSDLWSVSYWRSAVTGGNISYFA